MGRYPHLGAFEIEGPADIAASSRRSPRPARAISKDRPFTTLSGGEKQRVVIATALAQIFRPGEASGFLLLDEPTASLDLAYQLEVGGAPPAAARQAIGFTMVLSTHDLGPGGHASAAR